jgi:hypothetical protein
LAPPFGSLISTRAVKLFSLFGCWTTAAVPRPSFLLTPTETSVSGSGDVKLKTPSPYSFPETFSTD